MVSKVMCLLLGHDWFPTVDEESTYCYGIGPFFGQDRWVRTVCRHRICVRCQAVEVTHLRELERWGPGVYPEEQSLTPGFVTKPRTFHPLPGDWIS